MHATPDTIYTFIVNPRAGRGRYCGTGNPLEAAARAQGLNARFEYTAGRRHAADLAAAAAAVSDVVVAVGGDGTIHEVVSGLDRANAHAHLGVVASGTGNDFVKMFDLPSGLDQMLHVLATTPPSMIDFGRISWDGVDGSGKAVFVNVAGAGFDAKVAAAAAGFKVLRGTVRYLAAVLSTLRSWESPRLCITFYRAGERTGGMDENVLLALAGNGRCAAGGFYLTPSASVVDGLLDAFVVRHAGIGRILRLIPRVLMGGGHENAPEVVMRLVDTLELKSSMPIPVQADGELLAEGATSVRLEVAAGALSVVMPVKS